MKNKILKHMQQNEAYYCKNGKHNRKYRNIYFQLKEYVQKDYQLCKKHNQARLLNISSNNMMGG